MPRVKTKKLQKGGSLSFLVENNKFDIDENSMDANILSYIDSDPRLSKSKDAILNEYNQAKGRLREGATNGQFMNIDTGGDKAINITSDLNLTNEQRGLTDKGKAAKAGFLSGLTGVKDGAVISGAINKFIADSVSSAYAKNSADNILKQQEEAQAKSKIEEDNKRALAQKNSKLYGDTLRNLDLGSALYGLQMGFDGREAELAEDNYKRYHKDGKSKRSTDLAYLERLKGQFNQEGLIGDDEFNKAFYEKTGSDLQSFKDKLNAINLQDAQLNVQNVMDNLGLGVQYSRLNDASIWQNMNKKGTSTGGGSVPSSGRTTSAVNTDTADFTPEELNAMAKEQSDAEYANMTDTFNPNATGAGTFGTVDAVNQIPSSGGTEDPSELRYSRLSLGGKQYTPEQLIEAYNSGSISKVPGARESFATASSMLNRYKSRLNELSGNDWQTFDKGESNYSMPYFTNSANTSDIQGVSQLTHVFPSAKQSNNMYKFAIVNELANDGNVRTRYVDEDGEMMGYFKVDPATSNAKFYGLDKDGKVIKTKNLGRVDPNAKVGGGLIGNTLVYSWKAANKHTLGQQATSVANSYMKPAKTGKPTMTERLQDSNNILSLKRFQQGGTIDLNKLGASKGANRATQAVNVGAYFDKDYKLSDADMLDIGALGMDVASLVATLTNVPVVSGVAGGVTGIAGTSLGLAASKARGEERSWGDIALNYGLDVATMIPLAGNAAKIGKVGKTIQRALPIIKTLATAAGSYSLLNAANAVANGDYSLNNLQTLASGLAGLKGAGPNRNRKALVPDENAVSSFRINSKSGKAPIDVKMNRKQAMEFKAAKGANQRKIVTDLATSQNPNANVGDFKFPKQYKIFGNKSNLHNDLTRSDRPTSFLGNALDMGFKPMDAVKNPRKLGQDLRALVDQKYATRGLRFKTDAEVKATNNLNPFNWGTADAVKKSKFENAGLGLAGENSPKISTKDATKQAYIPSDKRYEALMGDSRMLDLTAPKNTYKNAVSSSTPIGKTNPFNRVTATSDMAVLPDVRGISYDNATKFSQGALEVRNPFKNENKTRATASEKTRAKDKQDKKVSPQNRIKNNKVQKGQLGLKFNSYENLLKNLNSGYGVNKNTNVKIPYSPEPTGVLANTTQVQNPYEKLTANLASGYGVLPKTGTANVPFKNTVTTPQPNILNGNTTNPTTGNLVPKATYTDPRKTFSLKANPMDLSEAGRALYNIGVTKKVDTRVEAPLMSNTLEILPSVKSNLRLRTAYDSAANRLQSVANQPLSSDANTNIMARLSAGAKGEEFRLQGALQDAENIARQEGALLDTSRQYAGQRAAVSNQNASSIAGKIQAERGLRNEQRASIGNSVDAFWSNMNLRGYQRQNQSKNIKSQLGDIEAANSPIGNNNLGIDPKSNMQQVLQGIQTQINPLLEKEATGTINAQETANLTKLRQQAKFITDKATKDSLNRQLGLVGNLEELFGFKYGSRPSITSSIMAKGGKMSLEDKLTIEKYKANVKAEANWLKDYNTWLSNKSKENSTSTINAMKEINSIIKATLKHDK